jgi:hypothetical protein
VANKSVKKLIEKYGGERILYRDLPKSAQLAIAHYMAIDGEAWPLPEIRKYPLNITSWLPKHLSYFVENWGDKPFGYVELPMEEVMADVMRNPEIKADFSDWEAYHDWYSVGPMPKHTSKDPWPVILSDYSDETLQDGWHRLHRYYDLGMETIPAVYYLPKVRYGV